MKFRQRAEVVKTVEGWPGYSHLIGFDEYKEAVNRVREENGVGRHIACRLEAGLEVVGSCSLSQGVVVKKRH